MEPLIIFEKFKLDELDRSWVKSIWDNDFITFDDLPSDYMMFVETEDMEILLRDTCTTVKNWICKNKDVNSEERSEVSWQTLCALNVDQQGLLALLGYIIKTGQGLNADEDSRQACLHATSLYLTLLAIPGSSAYQIFHENLYQHVINTLQLAEHLMPPMKKSAKNIDFESLYINDEEPSTSLLQTEKITLTKGLNIIMYNMILMLNSWCMRDYVRSLEITVHSLIEVTKLGIDSHEFQLQTRHSESSVASLAHNAYAALGELCHPRHGPVDVTIKLIAKYLLPHLLLSYTSMPIKPLNVVRDATIHFLKTLLNSHEKNAEAGIMILIQHIMINCPERLEARQKQSSIFVKLMNICTKSLCSKVVENIILFAHHNKISCRIFAQEIIGKILLDTPVDGDESLMQINNKKLIFSTVVGRCLDVSSMVRGKAMAIVAEYTDSADNLFVKEIFTLSDDEQRPIPTLENLQEAFKGNKNILLPNGNSLISMLKDRAMDERALVRRSAMQIARNAVLINSELLETVIPIVCDHCCDPAMTVRRYCIHILTTLFEIFPDYPNFTENYAKAVIPQIFDIEVKVQEKVLESLESLIINRIGKLSENNDNLPWIILNELTTMKMRKHLIKACDAWVHSGIINDSVIIKIQSHIGSEQNIPAWILLSAIAENKIIPNMKQHFTDYRSLLLGNSFSEHLALEVLRCCWPAFDHNFLQILSHDFYKSLYDLSVNTVSISICLDIICAISKHLHSTDNKKFESNMQELIKKCEEIIEKILTDHTEQNSNEYLKAICTLGHASLLCTIKINLPVLRILQGILIDWETMPATIKNVRELQAATVVVLGQQAMRDQIIAHEMMPIFGQLLCIGINSNSPVEEAVRVNAAKALADVCTRFTTLVEPYLPDMCISMKTGNTTVREAIVVIFIQLLVEDFIKVKGTFFFHILTMLSDPDNTIRKMTIFLIKERLLVKNKTLISQQFLESIFHYNDYHLVRKYSDRVMRQAEREALTLPGIINDQKRRLIYDFMLEHLDPPGKLKLLVRITSQVLNGILSDTINITDEKAMCVLHDSLYIIASDHLQPSSCTNKNNDDDMEENSTSMTNNATPPSNHAANIIAEAIKKHGIQVLLPTIVKLKNKLKCQSSSSLDVNITKVFVRIGSDFSKEQLSSFYNEFPHAEKELECGIRVYGKKCQMDMRTCEVNTNLPICHSTPRKTPVHPLLSSNRIPRIVLRRLSSLTAPIATADSSPSSSVDVTCGRLSTNSPSNALNISSTPKSSKKKKAKCRRF
ncbi:hypothetical protein PV325_011103 [Microctonus aethiopoides]|nr:hypothetical protein PV325_011103 [Microctonus aethiopoides]